MFQVQSPSLSRPDDPHAHLLNEYLADGKQVSDRDFADVEWEVIPTILESLSIKPVAVDIGGACWLSTRSADQAAP